MVMLCLMQLFKEQIPGKIIDLKCFRDKFAVLFMDSQGIYHILVFGETGVYQKRNFCKSSQHNKHI